MAKTKVLIDNIVRLEDEFARMIYVYHVSFQILEEHDVALSFLTESKGPKDPESLLYRLLALFDLRPDQVDLLRGKVLSISLDKGDFLVSL